MTGNRGYSYKILLHIISPLIGGCIIYLYYRHNTWLNMHLGFRSITSDNNLQSNWWHEVLVYNVPDFCWDYSFASALFIWRQKTAAGTKYFPIAVFVLLMISESIQIFFPGNFTFDWLDILAAILAFSLSYSLNYRT